MKALCVILAAGIHQRGCTHDIRLQEDPGILNRAVHMALRREIRHDVRTLFLKHVEHRFPVADIGLHEAEPGVLHDRRQRGQVARVGQFIQADDAVIRVLIQQIKDKVAANEPSAARYQYVHAASYSPDSARLIRYWPYSVIFRLSPSAFSCSVLINPLRQAISSMQEM